MLALSPNDPEVYLNLGKYNLKAQKYSDALTMFEKSSSIKSSAEALEGKAISEFYLNKFPQAKSSAIKAIKINGQLIEAKEILGKILVNEKDYKGAIENLEFVIQKTNCIECLQMLAECYMKTNNTQKLFEIDNKIIVIDQNNFESRLRLARNADGKKDIKEALRFYKELLSIKPEDTDILFKLYQLAVAENDFTSAMIYIKKYLSINPDSEIAHGALGDLYYYEKKTDEALNEYRIAMKLNPAVKGIQKRYAEIVIAKGLTAIKPKRKAEFMSEMILSNFRYTFPSRARSFWTFARTGNATLVKIGFNKVTGWLTRLNAKL
jgi:tetratricopeptide (TPR) repeat protein